MRCHSVHKSVTEGARKPRGGALGALVLSPGACRGDSHASYFVGVYPPFLLCGLYLPRTPLSQENDVLSVSEGEGEWKALRMLPMVPKMRGVPKSWDKGWRHRPDATAVWEEDRKGPN